jgi:hypothetical protein
MLDILLLIVVLVLIWRNGCCIKKRFSGLLCPHCSDCKCKECPICKKTKTCPNCPQSTDECKCTIKEAYGDYLFNQDL